MKTPTDQDLEAAVVDVAYEFKMFRRAWDRYCNGVPAGLSVSSPSLGHNDSTVGSPGPLSFSITQGVLQPKGEFLFLEGLLLHMRILVDFFYEKNRTDDNVLATDYSGVPQLAEPSWLFQFKQRCNKLVAHLTYKRTEHRSKDEHHWKDIEGLVQSMTKAIDDFLGALTPERREWFKNQGI